MDSALFYRKCANADEYFRLATNYPDLGSELHFIIDFTFVLSTDEYKHFTDGFLWDNDDIKKITKNLFMDKSDIVHCAYFTVDGSRGFLVYPSGYNYARYIAYYESNKKIIKGD